MTNRRPQSKFEITIQGILGLVSVIAIFVLLFFIASGIFRILSWAAPFLLVAALIINYRTVLGYGGFLIDLLRRRLLLGLLAVLLTIVGFPVVIGFLFGKALIDRRIRKMYLDMDEKDEFVEYEDLTKEGDRLELRQLGKEEDGDETFDDASGRNST